ncbi:MAG: DNA polymerase III subunit beta [Gammaproteobacteria bacterium]|nr:DNA polymerase III subunit beta [Gammaproteobacteria bacterium]
MKFNIGRETLLKPLQMVNGVVEKRQTMPILSNILLSATPESLTMTGTDLEVEMITRTHLDNADAGEVTLPARKFSDICRALPDDAIIEVEVNGDRAIIRSGKSRFTLSTLPVVEFPNVEEINNPFTFTIAQSHMKGLIDKTSFAMAQQDVRYYLNGMLLEMADHTIRAVATDGHRLSLSEVGTEHNPEEMIQVIVPRKAVMELSRLLEDSDELVEIQVGTNHIKFSLNDVTFTSKLIDGKFPDYERVFPKNSDKQVVANRLILSQALARTSILSNEKYRGIRLQLSPGILHTMAHNPEQEEAEEEVEVNYQGVELEVGFNANYMLDALNAVATEDVKVWLSDPNSSCLIHGLDDEQSKYVIMPMRL